jgi:hypothetical protein
MAAITQPALHRRHPREETSRARRPAASLPRRPHRVYWPPPDLIKSLRCLARSGIDKLALVNGHGGIYVQSNITQQANTAGPRVVLFPSRDDWITARG